MTFLTRCNKAIERTEQQPNLIIINMDDLGYDDVGAYDAESISTPNMVGQ
ncbi:hypothetical protein [Sphingobacterium gobiense]|nr:hypothetical protein [Sphingobacterium gobiense]